MRRSRSSLKIVSVVLTLSISVPIPAQETAPSPVAVAAFRAGQQAFQREEFDAAAAQFKAAVAADPRFAAARCALGQTYMTLRRYAEAVEALVSCKSLTERQAAAQASARAAQEREADREIRELRQAIANLRSGQVKTDSPENAILRLEERIRRLEAARNREAASSAVPPAILFVLGTAYLRAGSLEAAAKELGEAVRVKPDMGEAHNNLAAVYAGLGRWEEAARHLRLAESAGFPVSESLKGDVAARRAPAPAPTAGTTAPAAPVAPAPAAAAEVPLAIEHAPLTCVAAAMFPRIVARVTPAGSTTAKAFFRTDEDAGWFAVHLRSDDESYSAVLPRPRSVRSFRYYIEATGEDTRTTKSPEYVTAVVDRPEQCAGKTSDSVASASGIVVEPPATAKQRSVPPGFSARGTVGDIGQFEMGTKLAVGAGIVLAGAAVAGAATAASKGSDAPPPTTIPPRPDLGGDITLVSSDPPPGGTISLTSSVVSMSFRAVSPYAVPAGPARVQFSRTSSAFFSCATLSGSHPGLRANEPITVSFSGRVVNTGGCGDQFDVRLIRVFFQESGGPQVLQTGTGFLPDIPLILAVVP